MSCIFKYTLSCIFICYFSFVCIAQKNEYPIVHEGDMDFYVYTPEKGEGLYSVSRKFEIPLSDIIYYNPNLGNVLKEGSKVLIPIKKELNKKYHIIAPKETLYGVSKKYNLTPEDLMSVNPGLNEQTFSIGRKIEIPITNSTHNLDTHSTLTDTSKLPDNIINETEKHLSKKDKYSIVLMLPFNGKNDSSSINTRFIEYYEGFLLAVDSMKSKGLSLDLFVYNTDEVGQSVQQLIQYNTIKQADLIIGGITPEEIITLSHFSKDTNIKYVIPFSSKEHESVTGSNIFQINPPQALIQSKAANIYSSLFRDKNIILINWPEENNNKQNFIHFLRSNLNNTHSSFFSINYSENLINDLKEYLNPNGKNIILPTSSSPEALTSIAPTLRLLATSDSIQISLYGYPEWQVYAKDIIEDLFLLDTHFYSTFYANNTSAEIKEFYNKYKNWYHKSLLNTYPKYGMLGFDTGMYFLNALHQFGTSFDNHLNECSLPLLQTSFNFHSASDDDIFTNMNLFIVQFNPDFSLKKSIAR